MIVGISIIILLRLVWKEQPRPKQKVTEQSTVRESDEPSIQEVDTSNAEVSVFTSVAYELPACSEAQIIRHAGYCLQYDEPNEQASWVAYQLTAAETVKRFKRTDRFLPDPAISSGSATDKDYKRSGFDRGHLAPAADMGWSAQSMSESFYYSNMSPQVPGFNRGIWRRLEEQVRNWAVELDTIYVITGPVLSGKMSHIGPDHVSVPNYYFKAVLYINGKDSRMIGFVMPNAASKSHLINYAISVDRIEKLTGLDLFTGVYDGLENTLERSTCSACWSWLTSDWRSKETVRKTESVQCSGITRAGKRCKRRTRNSSGRCYQHG